MGENLTNLTKFNKFNISDVDRGDKHTLLNRIGPEIRGSTRSDVYASASRLEGGMLVAKNA